MVALIGNYFRVQTNKIQCLKINCNWESEGVFVNLKDSLKLFYCRIIPPTPVKNKFPIYFVTQLKQSKCHLLA